VSKKRKGRVAGENALTTPKAVDGDFALEIFDNVCDERENWRRQIGQH